jgi:hypothetical protein
LTISPIVVRLCHGPSVAASTRSAIRAESAGAGEGGDILSHVVVAERFPQEQIDRLLPEAGPAKNARGLGGKQFRGPDKLVVGEIQHPVIVADKHARAQLVSRLSAQLGLAVRQSPRASRMPAAIPPAR